MALELVLEHSSPPLVQHEPDIALTFTNICNQMMETKSQPGQEQE